VTEKQWLKSTDPEAMLTHLGARASDRKLRLFACACCRRAWHFVRAKRLPQLLKILEDVADGLVKDVAREKARDRAYAVADDRRLDDMQQCLGFEIWGALDDTILRKGNDFGECAAAAFGYKRGIGKKFDTGKAAERKQQPAVVREIFGDPFRKVKFDPAWRTDTATTLAKQMYEAREFSAAPILADALQDAGCTSEDILNHLRDPKATHYRGCWAIDLVLGKE
jgi:hypothetical protein